MIKVASWWDLKPAGTTAGEKARLEKIAEIEKKYNCKIEFVNVPFEEYMNKFTTSVLAGEPFADIVRLEYKSALPAIMKGQILPISEFTTDQNNINNEADLQTKYPAIGGGNTDSIIRPPSDLDFITIAICLRRTASRIFRSCMPRENGTGINSWRSPSRQPRIPITTGKPTYGASPVGRLMRLNISPPLTGQNR